MLEPLLRELAELELDALAELSDGSCKAGLTKSVGTASGFSIRRFCSPKLAAIVDSG